MLQPTTNDERPTTNDQRPMTNDQAIIMQWLHGRSPRTQRGYRTNADRLLLFVAPRSLRDVQLADLQRFADSLTHLAASSQTTILASVKSLISFAHDAGHLDSNTASALRTPSAKQKLSERILSEAQVFKMLALEEDLRNHALIRLLYAGGLRCAEACGLRWRDLQDRSDSGQVTVFGKGSKTRVVLLGGETWHELLALRGEAADDAPVFVSERGGALDTSQVYRIIKTAATRAKLPKGTSPHWLRHAHASHALNRGAPISLVQATLGHASVATTGRYLHARPDQSSSTFLPV